MPTYVCMCLYTYVQIYFIESSCTYVVFLVYISYTPADKLLYLCDCHGDYCKKVETVARYGQSQGSQVRASVWDICLACYDCPIRHL